MMMGGARLPLNPPLMIARVLGITALAAVTILCTVLPFLPGRYDSAAMSLSLLAQVVGKLGLLLVPVGVLWTLAESRSLTGRTRYGFTLTALVVASVVWLLSSLLLMTESVAVGLIAFALGIYVLVRLAPSLKVLRTEAPRSRSAVAVYLIIAPVAAALIQFAIADPITELSRTRAIRNSATMIADIEAYRTANGRYPPSTLSVWPDYKPSIIGIKEYRYEPSGDTYNVMFEQPSLRLGTREMVMYNPRDQQAIASHAMDVLQLTAEQLALDRQRGHYAVHDAPHPHWKYFWFD